MQFFYYYCLIIWDSNIVSTFNSPYISIAFFFSLTYLYFFYNNNYRFSKYINTYHFYLFECKFVFTNINFFLLRVEILVLLVLYDRYLSIVLSFTISFKIFYILLLSLSSIFIILFKAKIYYYTIILLFLITNIP